MEITLRKKATEPVKLLEVFGNDRKIYRAARISRNGDDEPDEEKLESFLYSLVKKCHWVPFEHAAITFEINAPIFVLRQLNRYRAFSISERSLRYTEADPVFYMDLADDDSSFATIEIDKIDVGNYLNSVCNGNPSRAYALAYSFAWKAYKNLLEIGTAQEQARAVLPLATFSREIVTCNLRGLLHVFDQRLDGHAQAETEDIVREMADLVKRHFPLTWKAYTKVKNENIIK